MNIKQAVERACACKTLSEALTDIVLWENDRVVQQAVSNMKNQTVNPDGSLYDTCFKFCIKQVIEQFPKVKLAEKDIKVKEFLSNIDGVDGIFRYENESLTYAEYYAIVREHGNIRQAVDIGTFEEQLKIEINFRAHQGRDMNEMFNGAKKIWVRGEDV